MGEYQLHIAIKLRNECILLGLRSAGNPRIAQNWVSVESRRQSFGFAEGARVKCLEGLKTVLPRFSAFYAKYVKQHDREH
jgi:hypothetical protein